MDAMISSRALRRPRRLDGRVVAGLVLFLAGVAGSLSIVSAAAPGRMVVMVQRDRPAGAVLSDGDLALTRATVADEVYRALVPGTELGQVAGRALSEPVHAGELLTEAALSPRPPLAPGQEALTMAIRPETAVGGRLQPGDAVSILLTTDPGKPDSQTRVVLPQVTVLDVGHDAQLTVVSTDLGGQTREQGPVAWLTVAVTPEQAVQLAHAKWQGELDVALLPPGR